MSYIYDLVDTWNDGATTFTAVKMTVTNTASSGTSKLIDLLTGTTSRFNVRADGFGAFNGGLTVNDTITGSLISLSSGGGPNGATIASGLSYGWVASAAQSFGAPDTILSRRAAANLRLGAADAAAPVAQTLSVQSVVAGTTNTAGTNLTITGSQGTGTGAGGSIIFQVAPAGGSGTAQNALTTRLQISAANAGIEVNNHVYSPSGSALYFASNGYVFGGQLMLNSASKKLQLPSDHMFSWSNDTTSYGTSDVILNRDAANTLALRNGTAAQRFNIYRTYTDASNYERLSVGIAGSNFDISVENAGTGVARPLRVFTTTSSALQLGTFNVLRWNIDTSGHFVANADNTYDIGAAGATRPRDIYLGGKIVTASVQAVSAGNGVVFRNNGAIGIAQVDANGAIDVCYNTTLPAGGTAGRGIRFSSNVTNMGVFFGSGSPTLSAAKGSLYLRSDGTTTNDRMYVNTDGATTWTAVTTAA